MDIVPEPIWLTFDTRRLRVYFDPGTQAAAPPAVGWLLPFAGGAPVGVPRIGPVGLRLLTGMYRAIGALAAAGVNVIVGDVIYDQRVLRAAADASSRSRHAG